MKFKQILAKENIIPVLNTSMLVSKFVHTWIYLLHNIIIVHTTFYLQVNIKLLHESGDSHSSLMTAASLLH